MFKGTPCYGCEFHNKNTLHFSDRFVSEFWLKKWSETLTFNMTAGAFAAECTLCSSTIVMKNVHATKFQMCFYRFCNWKGIQCLYLTTL